MPKQTIVCCGDSCTNHVGVPKPSGNSYYDFAHVRDGWTRLIGGKYFCPKCCKKADRGSTNILPSAKTGKYTCSTPGKPMRKSKAKFPAFNVY